MPQVPTSVDAWLTMFATLAVVLLNAFIGYLHNKNLANQKTLLEQVTSNAAAMQKAEAFHAGAVAAAADPIAAMVTATKVLGDPTKLDEIVKTP